MIKSSQACSVARVDGTVPRSPATAVRLRAVRGLRERKIAPYGKPLPTKTATPTYRYRQASLYTALYRVRKIRPSGYYQTLYPST
jgi:hypothetical protein